MSINPLTIEAAGPIYRWDNGMGDTLDSLVSILEREQDWEDCASFYEACFEGALALVSRPVRVSQVAIEAGAYCCIADSIGTGHSIGCAL